MQLTNRELDILGQAYQNAYDDLVKHLKVSGKSHSDICTIANTWQWFKVVIKEINNQTFDYISKEDWMKNPYTSFDGLTELEVRR